MLHVWTLNLVLFKFLFPLVPWTVWLPSRPSLSCSCLQTSVQGSLRYTIVSSSSGSKAIIVNFIAMFRFLSRSANLPGLTLRCHHRAAVDVTLPDHVRCDNCCLALPCPAHDASNPALAAFKADLGIPTYTSSSDNNPLDQHLEALAGAANYFASLDLNQAQHLVQVQDDLDKVQVVIRSFNSWQLCNLSLRTWPLSRPRT